MCNNSTSMCNCIYQTYLCSLFPSPLFNKYVQIIESISYSHAYYKSQGYHSRWMVYHPIRQGRIMVNIYIFPHICICMYPYTYVHMIALHIYIYVHVFKYIYIVLIIVLPLLSSFFLLPLCSLIFYLYRL